MTRRVIGKWVVASIFSLYLLIIPTNSASASYTTGSAQFGGSGQYLSIPGSTDLAPGTGNFTVEWWQYMTAAPGDTSVGNWPRVWWMSGSFGVSIESSPDPVFYLWVGGAINVGTMTNFSTTYKNKWLHVAVTRSGTSLKVFFNGTQFGNTITNNTDLSNSTTALAIGNRADDSARCAFPGLITNFHFVKGTALYTSKFDTPTAVTAPVANSKLLLNFANSNSLLSDSSGTSKVVSNNAAVTFSTSSPAWADITPATISNPTWSGNLMKGSTTQVSVTVNYPGKATFFLNGKRIANCVSINTSGSGPTYTATCNLKSNIGGWGKIYASFTPTSSNIASVTSQSVTTWVNRRNNTR